MCIPAFHVNVAHAHALLTLDTRLVAPNHDCGMHRCIPHTMYDLMMRIVQTDAHCEFEEGVKLCGMKHITCQSSDTWYDTTHMNVPCHDDMPADTTRHVSIVMSVCVVTHLFDQEWTKLFRSVHV